MQSQKVIALERGEPPVPGWGRGARRASAQGAGGISPAPPAHRSSTRTTCARVALDAVYITRNRAPDRCSAGVVSLEVTVHAVGSVVPVRQAFARSAVPS